MTIVYSSNTGYTKQYAELLRKATGYPMFSLDRLPSYVKGDDAIYLGWLMAGNVTGLNRAKSKLNVRCVVATGMTPESPEQAEFLHKKCGLPAGVPLFYLQAGYDFSRLHGIYKAMMSFKSKELLARFDGKSDEEKEASEVYRMLTRGESVVSAERLEPVIAWAEEHL